MLILSAHPETRNPFWRSAKLAGLVYVGLCLGGISHGAEPFLRIPEQDRAILHAVAQEYRLTSAQRRLLFAIRLAENGPAGVEMGVLVPRAQRFAGNHAKSLHCQARWAAGTIRKRFTGDLQAFAVRWCPENAHPLNRHWLRNVRALMGGR